MYAKFNALAYKTASYIESVQPGLDKLAEYDAAKKLFVEKATKAASVLAEKGLIERSHANELVDKVAEAPETVWDLVEKMAASFSSDDLGSVSTKKVAGDTTADPFEREFFGNTANFNGMID